MARLRQRHDATEEQRASEARYRGVADSGAAILDDQVYNTVIDIRVSTHTHSIERIVLC